MKPVVPLAAAVAAALAAGCAGPGRPAMEKAGEAARPVAPLAPAVAEAPADPARRATAALAAGRFAEAAALNAILLAHTPDDHRAQLGYALAQLGLGRAEPALARLRALAADSDGLAAAGLEADVGLALALAGAADEGTALLERAARRPDATARTRQNLAFALALADRWQDARRLAEGDSGVQAASWQLTRWAAWAALPPSHRLASVLGIAPGAADAQTTLAGAATADEPPLLLAARPAPAFAPTAAPVLAMAAPAPDAPVPAASPENSTLAPAAPEARPAEAEPAPLDRWVIQLAAFRHAGHLEASWQTLTQRHPALLSAYAPQVLEDGVWTRLAIGGFSDRQEALRRCRTLRRSGIDCFARPMSAQMAYHPLHAARG